VRDSDLDALRTHHRFLRDLDEAPLSWGERLAARYYARLFREFAIADLSRFREQRLGLRWRTEAEVRSGKGQFSCGARRCDSQDELATFEVPFAYEEAGEEKQALVKLRLCCACAEKLNYGRAEKAHAPRERKKRRRESAAGEAAGEAQAAQDGAGEAAPVAPAVGTAEEEAAFWRGDAARVEEGAEQVEAAMDAYLASLF